MSDSKENKNLTETEDPFTQFMFGPRRRVNFDQEEDQNVTMENDVSNNHRGALHDEWLFGTGKRQGEGQEIYGENNKINQIINHINFGELMENIDVLVHSASQLKPLLKKASPIIEQFLKK